MLVASGGLVTIDALLLASGGLVTVDALLIAGGGLVTVDALLIASGGLVTVKRFATLLTLLAGGIGDEATDAFDKVSITYSSNCEIRTTIFRLIVFY